MYISSCRHQIQISTVQSEEQHVIKLFSKFHLNRTVNEKGNAILQNLCKLEKSVAPSARKIKGWRYQSCAWRPRIGLLLMRIWDYAGHHDHTLQYQTIIKHVYTWRNYPNLLILAQNGGIKTSVVPPLVQPWPSPSTLDALINFHITLTFRPSFRS